MPGAGRQHRDVARGKVERLAAWPAELHTRSPARNAERLVDHRMVVHERIDAVAPLAVVPAVLREQVLDRARRIMPAEIDRAFVDECGQRRIVRHHAVVPEQEGEGFWWGHPDTTNRGARGCMRPRLGNLAFGLPHHLDEAREEIMTVARAG